MANKQFVVASLPVNRYVKRGESAGGTWGSITGTLASQTDLQTALDTKVGDTGDETIAGVKTFSSDPIIPDEVYGSGWNGSLEPATKNAIYDKVETLGSPTPQRLWYCDASATPDGQKIVSISTGSGATTCVSGLHNLSTGATDSSNAGYKGDMENSAYNLFDHNPETSFTLKPNSQAGTYEAFFGIGSFVSGYLQTTQKHMGIIVSCVAGTVTYKTSHANGTTQVTNTFTGPSIGTAGFYYIVYNGTDIKFYYNGTLKATHTTNLPSGSPDYFFVSLINNADGNASDNSARIGDVVVKWDAI